MGHDISAFKIESKNDDNIGFREGEEISYACFSAGNIVGQYLFYESLNAQKFNAGCSGGGGRDVYTIDQIKTAKSKLNYISSDDNVSAEIKRYSFDEKHNIFKNLIDRLNGNPESALLKGDAERIKHEIKKINQFYDNILNSGEETIMIGFY
jgi:hypothetical protein